MTLGAKKYVELCGLSSYPMSSYADSTVLRICNFLLAPETLPMHFPTHICNFFVALEELHISLFYCSYKRNTVEYGYMQLLPICNFFLAPKVTFALKTRQLYATDGYMQLFCGSGGVAYIRILL